MGWAVAHIIVLFVCFTYHTHESHTISNRESTRETPRNPQRTRAALVTHAYKTDGAGGEYTDDEEETRSGRRPRVNREMGWKAAEKLIRHWKVLRGDNVMIIRGKDKGETGTIKRVIRSQNRVIVEGKNLVKKHIKQGQGHEGGIFAVEAPIHASNVQVLDPVTGKPCKVGVKYLEDGTKVRVSRGIGASESIIPRPEILKIRTTPRPTLLGPKDTPMDLVLEKTYDAKTGRGMPEL
ncbi:hypothetical protein VIGAN_03229500 [Vigna angularis var. angularis]|uniref:KOW domain-containing protein n=2 Tax=Phaseolus angularis TaxID=3914 RepID=A0A0S3RPF8_PHAAN|nr:hypothetical protein VIGAN_03229500 [Vigna angularis var. angularis]